MQLKLDLDEKMEPLSLDPRELYQVLANLVGNALDACTLGDGLPSEPETTIRSRSLPEEKILLEVRDNGVGMSEEVRKKLFTIFFSTKGSRGTGLGLLLSHKIVQEHGGGNPSGIHSPTGRGISGHFTQENIGPTRRLRLHPAS